MYSRHCLSTATQAYFLNKENKCSSSIDCFANTDPHTGDDPLCVKQENILNNFMLSFFHLNNCVKCILDILTYVTYVMLWQLLKQNNNSFDA